MFKNNWTIWTEQQLAQASWIDIKIEIEIQDNQEQCMKNTKNNNNTKCSCRLTRVVSMRGLSSRARVPSFCSVCEYLKRSEQKGTLAAVWTPTIKLARNIKGWHTSVSEHRERMLWRWSNNTEWLILCALIACAHSGCAVKQLGFLALCKLWELG